MGRRNYSRNANRKSKPNKFMQAVNSAPSEKSNTMVFRWDINLKDFDTSNFNSSKSNGRIDQSDIHRVIDELKNSVKNYKVRHNGDNVFFFFCVGGFVLGLVLTLITAAAGLQNLAGMMFYLAFIACCCLGFVGIARWNSQIEQRGRDIQNIINNYNTLEFSSKGVTFRTNALATYLEVEVSEGGGGFNTGRINAPAPINNNIPPPMMMNRPPMNNGFRPMPPAYNPGHMNQVSPLNPPPMPPIMNNPYPGYPGGNNIIVGNPGFYQGGSVGEGIPIQNINVARNDNGNPGYAKF